MFVKSVASKYLLSTVMLALVGDYVVAGTIAFDVPGSTSTVGKGINNSGQTVGFYFTGEGRGEGDRQGFLRNPDGSFVTFNFPGVLTCQADSINNEGFISGSYFYGSARASSFIRDPDGRFISYDAPGSTRTFGYGINASLHVAGFFEDAAGAHGFIRDIAGNFVNFEVPGGIGQTYPGGINDSGQVAGSYNDAAGNAHGFIRNSNGSYVTFDVPGSVATEASDINNSGVVAGDFVTFNSSIGYRRHGFIRDVNGMFTIIDLPGVRATMPGGINEFGDVAGVFDVITTAGRLNHGFILAVPEPTSSLTLGWGLILLFAYLKKEKGQRQTRCSA